MNRRGFLSLIATGAAAVVAERVLPAPPPMARPDLRVLRAMAPPPMMQRYCVSFASELGGGVQEIVEPGGIVRLVARPQMVFRPERLIFADGIELAKFELLQVDTHGEHQLAGSVPAEMFSPLAYGQSLRPDERLARRLVDRDDADEDDAIGMPRHYFEACGPGEEIILALRNVSKEDAEFRAAAMIGSARL